MLMNQEEPSCDPAVILNDLRKTFPVHDFFVDITDFKKFSQSVNYPEDYANLFGGFVTEKLLEHYLSTILLDFSENDRFIDIAASHSYYSDFIQRKRIESYKQDLIYPKGITVSANSSVPNVGGSAADLPFKDNYFTKMTLHCSIEHFEDNDDIVFMKEASRVIQSQGKICLLPLYFGERYHLVTDPEVYKKEKDSIHFEKDVPIYFKKGYGNRHCRLYSIDQFRKRMVEPDIWNVDIFHVTNLDEISSGLYCKFAAVFTKK